MNTIILQNPSTRETRAVLAASMLQDDIKVVSASINWLTSHAQALRDGALPVGSVEFIREAMHLAGMDEPDNMSYPEEGRPYLHRQVMQRPAGEVLGRWFVKPMETKAFTGFVFDTMDDPDALSQHDQEQYKAFSSMAADALVWVSEPVKWLSEWRYYIHEGKIVGEGRYDPDGEDDAPKPALDVVIACINDLAIPFNYALDFGVLSTGETAMVEANDAWAIGLYGNTLSGRDYLTFLQARWRDMHLASPASNLFSS